MPTRLSYGNSRLIPAPLVSINKTFQTTGDGTKIGSSFNITLNGTIVVDMGSPNSNGVFWTAGGYPPNETILPDSRLAAILRKQEAIRRLFSQDGLTLEIQSADGSPPLKCNPRVVSTTDSEGIWFNSESYSINLEADKLYLGSDEIDDGFEEYISSADETWSIESDETGSEDFPPTYRISHTVNATGKRFFRDNQLDKPAWEQARDWVQKRLGFSPIVYSGINNIPDYYGGYNHLLSEQIGELNGTYSVTETWILSSGTAIEEFEISTVTNSNDPISRVNVNGTINGLDQKTNGFIQVSKIHNAEIKWSGIKDILYDRVLKYSDLALNPIPASTTVGKNISQGVITYQYEYNTRPSNYLTDSKSEVISLVDNNNADLFAVIPIPFRSIGPIIQDIYTKKEKTKTLNIEVFFGYDAGSSIEDRFINNHPENRFPQSGEIQNIIDALRPTNSKIAEHSYNWDGTNHYTKNITWTYV